MARRGEPPAHAGLRSRPTYAIPARPGVLRRGRDRSRPRQENDARRLGGCAQDRRSTARAVTPRTGARAVIAVVPGPASATPSRLNLLPLEARARAHALAAMAGVGADRAGGDAGGGGRASCRWCRSATTRSRCCSRPRPRACRPRPPTRVRREFERLQCDYNYALARKYMYPGTVQIIDDVTRRAARRHVAHRNWSSRPRQRQGHAARRCSCAANRPMAASSSACSRTASGSNRRRCARRRPSCSRVRAKCSTWARS